MSNVTIEQIGTHCLQENQYPSSDKEQWMAYLCLNHLFPTTKYWSMDGYHVHALVDYEHNILWEEDKITTTDRQEVIQGVNYFHYCSTEEIVKVWKQTIALLKEYRNE